MLFYVFYMVNFTSVVLVLNLVSSKCVSWGPRLLINVRIRLKIDNLENVLLLRLFQRFCAIGPGHITDQFSI